MNKCLLFFCLNILLISNTNAQQSVARKWNEVNLAAIREDLARPPVQARNLFHVSIAMYDAWAAYDANATTYLIGKTVGGDDYPYSGITAVYPTNVDSARKVAISYAAYRVLLKRYANSPNATTSLNRFHNLMISLGYDTSYRATNYATGTPADLGNFIASQVIQMGLNDHAREQQNYSAADYLPVNAPMYVDVMGNPNMNNPNNWQPLYINTAFDQNGNPIGSLQKFICPEWGRVTPFSLTNPTNHSRNGNPYPVYLDPGAPPMLDTVNANDSSSFYFKWGHSMVATWSSHLSPDDGVLWDISPKSRGNVQSLPTTLAGQYNFYNFLQGGDPGTGYTVNPATGNPYTPNMVKRGDFTRVISQYWADGPQSETPPGHWYVLLNEVSDHPLFVKKYEGTGNVLNSLEWDVKTYFTLGGAVHDAAIAAWGIKGWYDAPRPISMLRKMALYGQSTSAALPSYHPAGIPLQTGYIELVYAGDSLAGAGNTNVGKIKIKAWKGFGNIINPYADYAGVGWILAENWMPYQRQTFVTPPFAGYVSGHSTYSRAAAEVLTNLTGNAYFPGGLSDHLIPANNFFLGFENGPSNDMHIQWATYRDASDQSSLSRIWGGIHPPFDDIPGRIIGQQIGIAAHAKAKAYFNSSILPITLEQFTAYENNCTTRIEWATSMEQNTANYTIVRSNNGNNFTDTIATIAAIGFSNNLKRYSVTDASPALNNYYKLIATDRDGKQKAFTIVNVKMKTCSGLLQNLITAVYPNPAWHNTTLTLDNKMNKKQYQIDVYDLTGKLQFIQNGLLQSGKNNIIVQTEQLVAGTYVIKIRIDGVFVETQKLTKLSK
jgi:Secretion system C-terminal sorting domain